MPLPTPEPLFRRDHFINRELSLLQFQRRVLAQAADPAMPLLERLRYLCIVSSNLDEWFEVRCAPHVSAAKVGDEQGPYSRASFERLMTTAHGLVAKQYQLYNQSIIPAFDKHAIRLVSHGERSVAQRKWVREIGRAHV